MKETRWKSESKLRRITPEYSWKEIENLRAEGAQEPEIYQKAKLERKVILGLIPVILITILIIKFLY